MLLTDSAEAFGDLVNIGWLADRWHSGPGRFPLRRRDADWMGLRPFRSGDLSGVEGDDRDLLLVDDGQDPPAGLDRADNEVVQAAGPLHAAAIHAEISIWRVPPETGPDLDHRGPESDADSVTSA